MAEWKAAALLSQIDRLDALIATRRGLYAEYLGRLRGATRFGSPTIDADNEWAPIRLPIRVRRDKLDFYGQASRRFASPSASALSQALILSVHIVWQLPSVTFHFTTGLLTTNFRRSLRCCAISIEVSIT